MANGNPFLPGAVQPWDFKEWRGDYGPDDSPFGHGLVDIDYSGGVYEEGYTPSFPATGDIEFDEGLKRAVEANDSKVVWDYLKSWMGTDKEIMAHQLFPFANRESMYRKYGLSRPVYSGSDIVDAPEGVEQGSASSTELRFSDNPFARILGEVFQSFRGEK